MFDGRLDGTYVSAVYSVVTCCWPKADFDHSVQFMRDLLLFFGVKFKVTPFRKPARPDAAGGADSDAEDEEEERNPTLQVADDKEGTGEVLVSCLGIGYSNVNKAMA